MRSISAGEVGESNTPADGEQRALAALERGDREQALTLLMDAYGESVFRYCRRMVGDSDLANDVHQTTYVQAFEALPRFERRSSLRTWIFGIARHRCLDALKARRRRERRFEVLDELPDQPALGAEQETGLAVREFSRGLERCLEGLTPASRTAVLLRYAEGFSYPEMASVCGDEPGTLRVRVARALPVLRGCLERQGLRW